MNRNNVTSSKIYAYHYHFELHQCSACEHDGNENQFFEIGRTNTFGKYPY